MKKMNKYLSLIIVLSLVLLLSCEKDENNVSFEDIPVVEGYLYNGKPLEIKISRQIPFSDEMEFSDDNIDSLNITLFDGQDYYTLASFGEGIYKDTNLIVESSNTYEVEFTYNSSLVSASTVVPAKPDNFQSSASEVLISDDIFSENVPEEVELNWNNPDGSYYVIVIENIETNPDPIREFNSDDIPEQLFRLPPTQSDNFSIKSRRFAYYGNHRVVLYHINPDYAALYDDEQTTSQNLTNPSTEIENGYGIFTGLNTDTLYIDINPL